MTTCIVTFVQMQTVSYWLLDCEGNLWVTHFCSPFSVEEYQQNLRVRKEAKKVARIFKRCVSFAGASLFSQGVNSQLIASTHKDLFLSKWKDLSKKWLWIHEKPEISFLLLLLLLLLLFWCEQPLNVSIVMHLYSYRPACMRYNL